MIKNNFCDAFGDCLAKSLEEEATCAHYQRAFVSRICGCIMRTWFDRCMSPHANVAAAETNMQRKYHPATHPEEVTSHE